MNYSQASVSPCGVEPAPATDGFGNPWPPILTLPALPSGEFSYTRDHFPQSCKVGWTGERCDCAKCETYRANLAAIKTPQEWFAEFERLLSALESAVIDVAGSWADEQVGIQIDKAHAERRAALLDHVRRRID